MTYTLTWKGHDCFVESADGKGRLEQPPALVLLTRNGFANGEADVRKR